MHRMFLLAAASAGFLGVVLGAFGAHALRARLAPQMLATFQTGVLYQLLHALVLLWIASSATRLPSFWANVAGSCFIAGISLFSGSLYILSTTGSRAWGMVTPVGGMAFLLGWAALGLAAWRLPP